MANDIVLNNRQGAGADGNPELSAERPGIDYNARLLLPIY